MAKTQQTKSKKLLKWILVAAGSALLVLVVLPLAYLTVTTIPGNTDKLEEIGARFEPDPSWTLVSESVNPPRFTCFSAQCDQLRKVWDLPTELKTEQEFQRIATLKGQVIPIYECSIEGEVSSGSRYCKARKQIDEYQVNISYSKFNDDKPDIILQVEK